jgi:hypothetical protein
LFLPTGNSPQTESGEVDVRVATPMQNPERATAFRLSSLRVGLVLLLMGCTRWESYEVPAPAPPLPSYLRVSAPGRSSAVLVHPFVRLDTLYGRSGGDTLGFALPVVGQVERPRLDGLRTAAVVVGSLGAWIGLGLLVGAQEE